MTFLMVVRHLCWLKRTSCLHDGGHEVYGQALDAQVSSYWPGYGPAKQASEPQSPKLSVLGAKPRSSNAWITARQTRTRLSDKRAHHNTVVRKLAHQPRLANLRELCGVPGVDERDWRSTLRQRLIARTTLSLACTSRLLRTTPSCSFRT
jgi:hypothetical protein